MILVITKNNDAVTSRICYWLMYLKKEFKIISEEDEVELVDLKKESLLINNVSRDYFLNLNTVKKILYRQGDVFINRDIMLKDKSHLSDFINRERTVLHDFIYNKINEIDHFGHPQHANLNKLIVLEKAIKYNLLVPDYIYTSLKSSLISFNKNHPKIITKSILPGYYIKTENGFYSSYTELFSEEDIYKVDEKFYPTFFQKLINKKFEIRAFYLNNEFYCVAIISLNNLKTQIDYRKYDKEQPNRNIPFKLPMIIQKKLKKLIKDLSLKYCSIDLIYGEDQQFYFLEINPIGQFGNVSYFGNYYLEMQVAKLL